MEGIANLQIRSCADGAIIAVKVVPGSSRDKLVGVLGDALKIATSAPPEKGKANAAVARILGEALGVDRRDVKIISGRAGPRKEFHIAGMTASQVKAALSGRED